MRASRGIYNGGNQFISNDEIDQSNHCGKHFGQFQVNLDLVNVAGPSCFIHTFDCPAGAGRESQRVLRIVSPAERRQPAYM